MARRGDPAPGVISLDASDPSSLLRAEWLLPDGLGGYAMGTALGARTRRYHALLVSATRPPIGRIVALAGTVDALIVDPGGATERRVELSSFRFGGGLLHPDGHRRLRSFERSDPFREDRVSVRWRFDVDGAEVVREVRPLWRTGGVRIDYSVGPSRAARRIVVRPLVALRDFHALLRRDGASPFHVRTEPRCAEISRDGLVVRIASSTGSWREAQDWWMDFRLDREAERSYDDREDLFSPGEFSLDVAPGAGGRLTIIARAGTSAEQCAIPPTMFDDADERPFILRETLARMPGAAADPDLPLLVQAADDFLVPRTVGGERMTTVLAGYPWFADWGRDALLSLPGLLLATGRFEEARGIVEAFARYERRGLLPNCFHDGSNEPAYNSIDAPMWLLHAVAALAEAAGADAVPARALDACLSIVESWRAGTDFGVRIDGDGLPACDDPQLTWMDAKSGDVIHTPRAGKPVEVCALWISGLEGLSRLGAAFARGSDLARLGPMAGRAREAFVRSFWLAPEGRLADRLERRGSGWAPIAEVRPNMLIASSLERSPLTREHRAACARTARDHLWTPLGMRTLAPGSPGYRARYEGGMFERDRAYHNGTAWPFLLGFYAETVLRAGGFDEASRAEAARAFEGVLSRMRAGGLGQIAEVADAEGSPGAPQRPDGCPAQAWSVAAALRIRAMLLTRK